MPPTLPNLPTGTIGAIGELAAGADLLRRGYEVFRALSPACSCDLIALRDGRLLRIEVRTGTRNLRTGHVAWSKSPADKARSDHYCVVLGAGTELIYDPPLPDEADELSATA